MSKLGINQVWYNQITNKLYTTDIVFGNLVVSDHKMRAWIFQSKVDNPRKGWAYIGELY